MRRPGSSGPFSFEKDRLVADLSILSSLISVLVTEIQPPRVSAVNDLLVKWGLPRPRTWARWMPVTSTGMRELGEMHYSR
ncbi:hypothetical protein AOG23_10590 [Rhizobium acidisoli]|nr:hypothetical protein AOG23_10590 [Rhizobium acidisoli]